MLRAILLLAIVILPVAALASTGPVDRYDCHRDPVTNDYHCHGSMLDAQQSHFLAGIVIPFDSWNYDDGPSNVFAGVGAEIEYGAFKHFAVHSGIQFKGHISGSDSYTLNGFDIGLKIGPNIVRTGTHLYGDVGYFSQVFNEPNETKTTMAGLQAGVGIISNQDDIAFDLRLLWRNTADLEGFWSQAGFPANTTNLSVQFGLYYRM